MTTSILPLTVGTPEHTEALRTEIRRIVTDDTHSEWEGELDESVINLIVRYYDVCEFHVDDILSDYKDGESYLSDQYDLLETLRKVNAI
jgi:uncharacterized lipoprotein YddW (UPF0748 family)